MTDKFEQMLQTLRTNHPDVSFGLSMQDDDVLFLDSIEIPEDKRGQGYGSSFMNELCSLADKMQFDIDLSPSSDSDDMDNDETFNRLVIFYERFGFTMTSEEDGYMIRNFSEVSDTFQP